MPAKSEKQRIAILIAEKSPAKLYGRNRSLLKMKPEDRKDFTAKPLAGPKLKRKYYGAE